jgi:hypothetical protein
MKKPFIAKKQGCRLVALMMPRSPIHAQEQAIVADVAADGGMF